MVVPVLWGRGLLRIEAVSPTARATLQDTGTQLRDARARKEQLAARVREVQAMLAMDTGRVGLLPALHPPLVPRAEGAPAHTGITPPALPVQWGHHPGGRPEWFQPWGLSPILRTCFWSGTRHQTNVTPSVSLGSK